MRVSVFAKLLVLMVASWLLVIVVAGVLIRVTTGAKADHRPVDDYVVTFGGYLLDDIGSPPDTDRAQELSDDLDLSIRIRAGDLLWESDDGMPSFNALRRFERADGVGWYRGRFFVRLETGSTTILFMERRTRDSSGPGHFLLSLGLSVALILTLAFLVMRRLLRPVHLLDAGVGRLASGDLATDVPVLSRDELGALTRSFNDMREHVRQMIQSREQLLLDVSHELRSPLTRVRLGLEFVKDAGARTSLAEDVGSMETLIATILELSRLESDYGELRTESVDVAALLEGLIAEMVGRKPGVTLHHVRGETSILADPVRLRIVFRNLLANALRHSPDDGPEVIVRLERGGQSVRITVEDSGPGVPEEDRERIFEPFYRADQSRSRDTGGYGLGLALCRRIVQGHNGSIAVADGEPAGTRFVVTLPG